jgi:CO/xanthine dehydrogenase FAD-binding subunit
MFWVQDVWPDSVYAYGFKKFRVLSTLLDVFVKFMFHNITAVAISSKGFNADIHASAEYRAHIIKVMAKKAISSC